MDFAEKVLTNIKEEAAKNHKDAAEYYRASEEKQKEVKDQLVQSFLLEGATAAGAKEMAEAQVEAMEKTGKQLEYQTIAADMAQRKRVEMVAKFGEVGAVLKTSISGLGTAIKDDFGQLTAMFGSLDSLPGFKTIKSLLTIATVTLAKLLLTSMKSADMIPDFIKDRISMDETGINLKDTLSNFNPFDMSDAKKNRISTETTNREAKEFENSAEGGNIFADLDSGPKKADGSLDMRYNENQPDPTFLEKSMANLKESTNKMGETFSSIGNGIMHPIQTLKKAGTAFMGGIKSIGVSIAGMAATMWTAVTTLAVSVASFVGGLLASAASVLIAGITMLAPVILIGLAVAALIFGVMYLRDKFIENKDMIMARWEVIKEGFAIALDGLVLWKDKAVTFISNTFKKISLGIQNMMVSILEGIEGAINWVIGGINKSLGWAGVDLDEVDIGASGMRASFDEDKAAFEVEKQNQSDEFARRQKDIDDRKSNNTMERGMTIVNQSANTVNEGSKDTMIVPTGTEPQDSFAGNMALAQ